ncbi:MAG TPA: PKD domain-containing protein [Jatrophihabitans sp.]|nr:PKD domain-containing protein [Jatrophihabitans sp.]
MTSSPRVQTGRALTVLTVFAAAAALVAVAAPAHAGSTRPSAPSHVSGGARAALAGSPAQLGSAAGSGAVRYAVTKKLCGDPTPGDYACDAIRLVPAARTVPGAKAYVTPSYSTGPAGGFTPADLASAYGFNPAASVNQTVAIVDAYDNPHALADLNTFNAHYGLPAETSSSFRKVNQAGNASPLPAANSGWAGEIALDIEAVRAVCNHCKILLVEANSASGANLAAAVNAAARLGATEISNSYGGPEDPAVPASVQAAYNHPGIVITASTGDNGWYNWDFANDSGGASDNAPNVPAAYPQVVAVAGTALGLNADGSRQEEDVWNENGADDQNGLNPYLGWMGAQGASGGGCSFLYGAPSWQAGVAGYSNTGCGSNRLAGDVAALADPYTGFDTYDNYGGSGWGTTGGTSLSSPLIAAMWALAGGAKGVQYPAQTLYRNLQLRPSSLYDVTLGGNAFCAGDTATNCSNALEAQTQPPTGNPNNLANGNSQYANGWAGLLDCGYPYDGSAGTIAANTQCNAVSGYDGPSGVGTPKGLNLFRPTSPTIGIGRPSALKLKSAQTWSAINFADPVGGSAVQYHWTWGDGSVTSTSSKSTSHTFTAAGTHKVTLTVTDSFGQTGSSSMTITVGVPPTAVIGGPTVVKINKSYTWTSAKSVDKNTGGAIASRTWRLGSTKVGTATTWSKKFTSIGKKTLTLVIVDNTGMRSTKSITITVTR